MNEDVRDPAASPQSLDLQRDRWAAQMRLAFSPPAMLNEQGAIDQVGTLPRWLILWRNSAPCD